MLNLVQINSWKSKNPLDILTSDDDFDIICVQEPHRNEVLNARDFPNYALIYPDAFDNHRVSVHIKLTSRGSFDLSRSEDVVISLFKSSSTWLGSAYRDYEDLLSGSSIEFLTLQLGRADFLPSFFSIRLVLLLNLLNILMLWQLHQTQYI
ncbi:hypothetical protein B0H13DRAFT_2330267 [Mycena leptocephala]|nr:hypothetical protein B0H13DRAFT_2330267 [Mycena leptocephala]